MVFYYSCHCRFYVAFWFLPSRLPWPLEQVGIVFRCRKVLFHLKGRRAVSFRQWGAKALFFCKGQKRGILIQDLSTDSGFRQWFSPFWISYSLREIYFKSHSHKFAWLILKGFKNNSMLIHFGTFLMTCFSSFFFPSLLLVSSEVIEKEIAIWKREVYEIS